MAKVSEKDLSEAIELHAKMLAGDLRKELETSLEAIPLNPAVFSHWRHSEGRDQFRLDLIYALKQQDVNLITIADAIRQKYTVPQDVCIKLCSKNNPACADMLLYIKENGVALRQVNNYLDKYIKAEPRVTYIFETTD